MNVLDVKISIFENYNSPDNPQEVNLLSFLRSAKYKTEVEAIRATADKEERNRLKAGLPAITPSGLFIRREEAALVKHSGLIQIDIDAQDNPHISNFREVKEQLKKLPEVAYLGLSVSGRGFWGLIPLAFPEKHKEQFEALKMDFAKWGLVLDEKPKNVAALRGYSFDPEAYFNPQARPYAKVWQPKPEIYRGQYNSAQGDEAEKVEACLAAIEAGRVDITGRHYDDWFAIGCALADEFGEGGRGYFHRASQFYPRYSSTETDKQFAHCLKSRKKGFTIGTFYQLCRDYGITFKDAFQKAPGMKQTPPRAAGNATAQTATLPKKAWQPEYIYQGDKYAKLGSYAGKTCRAIRKDGKCIRGKNGNMLVEFADGTPVVVLGRQLRKISPQEAPMPQSGTPAPAVEETPAQAAQWAKVARLKAQYYIARDRMKKAAAAQRAALGWKLLQGVGAAPPLPCPACLGGRQQSVFPIGVHAPKPPLVPR